MKFSSKKHKDIFEAAQLLFSKYGVKKVTIEEVCKEGNVSKMTFYKFYANKLELAKAVLDKLIDDSINTFYEIKDADIEFSEKLKRIFIFKMNAMNNLSKEFISDIYNSPQLELFQHLMNRSNEFQDEVINFYKKAQRDGNIRKDVNIDFILSFSKSIPKFMEDAELMCQYKDPKDFLFEAMNLMFYGIVSR